jgi:pentatricopeptide repeat protein
MPGSSRGVAAAHELLAEMRARGIPRSEVIYTTLMSLCVRAERLNDSLAVFNALLDEGLVPSLVTLHTLMDTYGQLQQWSNALAVLDVIASKVCS